jgi:hypothetical protein
VEGDSTGNTGAAPDSNNEDPAEADTGGLAIPEDRGCSCQRKTPKAEQRPSAMARRRRVDDFMDLDFFGTENH